MTRKRTSVMKLLDVLKDAGWLDSWKRIRNERDDGLRWTDFTTESSRGVSVGFEVYGKDARAYVWCGENYVATQVADWLKSELGIEVNWQWCKDQGDRFEIPVRYFKGWHHWE